MNSLDKMEDYDRLKRICDEKDAEIASLKAAFAETQHNQATLIRDGQQQLSAANALIARKDAALKEISGMSNVSATDKRFIYILQNLASEALSTSPESLSAWKMENDAKVLEELLPMIDKAKTAGYIWVKVKERIAELRAKQVKE